jgi:hypothetical protein
LGIAAKGNSGDRSLSDLEKGGGKMPSDPIVRLRTGKDTLDLPAKLEASGAGAAAAFDKVHGRDGVHLLLVGGDASYAVTLRSPVTADARAQLEALRGKSVLVVFPGRRAVRRRIGELAASAVVASSPVLAADALDLTEGRVGAAPLWLLPDGSFSTTSSAAPAGMAAREALINAARWISARRTSTFERLFPPSAFHPEAPLRPERLTAAQAGVLLDQLRSTLLAAAVTGDAAAKDALAAAEARSGALTVLSHVLATVLADPGFRAVASAAAAAIFDLIEHEQGSDAARAALRAHAILLLQLRGAALSGRDKERAVTLVKSLLRAAPPYAELTGPWNFAMCSDSEFHTGECEVLVAQHDFKPIDVPKDAPVIHGRWGDLGYSAFEAPFKTPKGEPIRVFARSASPDNENLEMGLPFFTGLLINRHAQLGSFDLKAVKTSVQQHGYKVMINSQCAGLTTRFAITRVFPDADVYSSWDSTFFRTEGGGESGKVNASEGLDCFVALLRGMSGGETHAQISGRIRRAQWSHPQALTVPDYVQFVGPAHPLVLTRFNDVDRDGRADCYDGYLDFRLAEIAEDIQASMTPRDPGLAASQIGGEAATGLGWAAGSMDRVTQYSDLWSGLPGASELLYAFQAGGFYSQREPPSDIPAGKLVEDPGSLPAVCRYHKDGTDIAGFQVDVMLHAWLAHSGKEMKRLLVAADALWRAIDLGYLAADGDLATLLGQRAMLLLTLAGLLEFPADQNFLDGLWAMALKALRLPEISRSLVRNCITSEDHDASNYYGSRRGLRQLLGALQNADPVVYAKMKSDSPEVGRAAPITLA